MTLMTKCAMTLLTANDRIEVNIQKRGGNIDYN